ncbi:CDP-diacylglycerol--glycerol-3-phosphate 3-phosphatidyltransferase [bacterium]|nr:CDP-diacylglycerol--glycerol-3-phosphate 3-phosphatidyltransferase [bacterium]
MKHIPNILTLLRVILVPFFIYYFTQGQLMLAFSLFIIASVTDYFDGYLARKYNVISNFGKIMDPLADKLLVLSALALLSFGSHNYLSIWIFIIITLRELVITILRDIYKKKKIFMAANNWGKIKTVTQMVGLTLSLFLLAININLADYLLYLNIYFWGVAIVTILSGWSYLKNMKELFN